MNFVKFLRIPFLTDYLWWLLLDLLIDCDIFSSFCTFDFCQFIFFLDYFFVKFVSDNDRFPHSLFNSRARFIFPEADVQRFS